MTPLQFHTMCMGMGIHRNDNVVAKREQALILLTIYIKIWALCHLLQGHCLLLHTYGWTKYGRDRVQNGRKQSVLDTYYIE